MKILFGWFTNLRIRAKLMFAFALILVSLAIVSTVSLWSSSSVTNTAETLFNEDMRVSELADEIQMAAYRMQTAEKDYFLRYKDIGLEQARETLVGFVEMQAELIDEVLADLGPLMHEESEMQLVEKIASHNLDFHLFFLETVDQVEERGYGDTGLEGIFKENTFLLEEQLNEVGNSDLIVDMLTIRRHEKDYMLSGDSQYIANLEETLESLKGNIAEAGLSSDKTTELLGMTDTYQSGFNELVEIDQLLIENQEFYRGAVNDMTFPLDEILELAMDRQETGLGNLLTTLSNSKTIVASMSVAAAVLGLLIAFVLSSIISKPIIGITTAIRNMAAGSLNEKLNADSKDEIGQLSSSMLEMQSKLKVIIKDEIFNIIDQAGRGNLSDRIKESDKDGFYQELAVSINKLIGVNESFLNETATVISSLADGRLDGTSNTQFHGKFGDVQRDIQRMQENFVQVISKDVQRIVSSASQGDLDNSIDLNGKVGFYLDLSQGINTLVETNAAIINDSMRVTGALADGNFNEQFSRKYQGSFARLQEYIERMHTNLRQAIEVDIHGIVSAAAEGDLKQRISLEQKQGFYLSLSRSINELVETNDSIISDATRVLSAMAKGDLTETITKQYKGTFNQLKQDINTTTEELINTVVNIQRAASSVDTGSDEISSGNANLSQRTEEQAASLEETSAAMEEMTTTVQLTAENSANANKLSQESIQTAELGEQVVNNSISSMNQIQESSNQIAEIVGVIDEIAFQTNLLALNASVEAARAGEQGKGFAVVADEVRVLAGRCAKAAKEIKELITNSAESVRSGSDLANKSGEALKDIIVAARKVNSIIGDISVSCDEQSTGIHEINTSLSQMDNMTQQNAALVEEAAAASESLSDQAKELTQLVGSFKIDKSHSSNQSYSDYGDAEIIEISDHMKAS